jgi:hypothetical protein
LGQNILRSTQFSNTLSLYILPSILETKYHIHTKPKAKFYNYVTGRITILIARMQFRRREMLRNNPQRRDCACSNLSERKYLKVNFPSDKTYFC